MPAPNESGSPSTNGILFRPSLPVQNEVDHAPVSAAPCLIRATRVLCLNLLLLALSILPLFVVRAQQPEIPPKRVLILYSFDNEQALFTSLDHVLRSELRSQVQGRVELYTEYLDLVRFPTPAHASNLAKLLEMKYSALKPDLIVAVSYSAAQFLLQDGKHLFPETPVVALFNTLRLAELKRMALVADRVITGVASTDEPRRTLDFALRLQPETQRVAVVLGNSLLEKYWLDQLKQDFSPYSGKVEITYLTGLSFQELLGRVAQLPPHSIVLASIYFEDARGQFFQQEDAVELIARNAAVPVYAFYSSYLGHGVVGGHMTNPEQVGFLLAGQAVSILNGTNAASIPIVVDNSAQDTLDWRQLRRWGISEKRLPAATVQLFREPSLWEKYHSLIIAAISVLLLEATLIIALVINVARRRRAEKGLLRETNLANAVIESLPGIFVLQDRGGKNLRWNKNAVLLAYAPPEATYLGNVAAKDKDAVERSREEVFERGSSHFEAEILLKAGGSAPFQFSAVRLDLEGQPHVAAVALDLTEVRKAEEAVRRSEAELRSFIENAPYGIGTISVQQDRFLRANPALVRILGYPSEKELLALTISRDLYPEGDAEVFRAQPTRADFFSSIEFTWKRKDGKPVNVHASGRRIPGKSGHGDLIEIIAEDVTARRLLEEQLHQSQRLEALGQLAGSVAHDFNNLLGVIIGYTELLSVEPQPDERAVSRLQTIKQAGQRAASLTAQLLAFSRRQMLQPRVLDLNALVRETEKMLQRLLGEDIEQKTILASGLGKTKADAGQLVQVIMNLAVNARDAMPRGGKLTISTCNVTFTDVTKVCDVEVPPGRYIRLSVSDSGEGMTAETRSRIFEPFFTTKASGKGTGLGLATAYGIVKQSGGYIFAESELGKGTTFDVYLPYVDQVEEEAPDLPIVPQHPPKRSETILVVEDEPALRALLLDGLQSRGYRVLAAANGVDALRVAEQHAGPIDLLITDVIMPQMSGPDLAKSLKEVRQDIEVLYMSGYTDDKLQNVPSAVGELRLIQKPFYIQELGQRMDEILAGKNMHGTP